MEGRVDDRELGEEWTDWDGRTPEIVRAGKGLFLGFGALGLTLLICLAGLLWYAITPRLAQLHPDLPLGIGLLLLGGGALLLGEFLGVVLSTTQKIKTSLLIRTRSRPFASRLLPLAIHLGRIFGVSRDRMDHSFIKVNNALVKSLSKEMGQGEILFLLPRCLRGPLREQLTKTGQERGYPTFTVGGGAMARKVVRQVQPIGIVAIACERELVEGIRDLVRIPVIAIPNQRPEGPCKDTEVDVSEVERALEAYAKKQGPIPAQLQEAQAG